VAALRDNVRAATVMKLSESELTASELEAWR